MKKEKEIRHLIELLLSGDITPAEQQRLKELLCADDLADDLAVYREMMQWMDRPLPVPNERKPRQRRTFLRVAVMLAFMVCIGAMAAIGYSQRAGSEASEFSETSEYSEFSESSEKFEASETTLANDITFDNVPLAEIAKQLSDAFGCTIVFADNEAESLRLYFTITRGSTIADFATIIDDYDTLTATLKEDTITIKKQEAQQ